MNTESLRKMISVWRFFGKKIVFTNGCFDLLHHGHLHLLNTARSFGDVLIVGLNSDSSVSKLKPGRPVQDEQSRTDLMASLEVVDAVILFEEETPEKLIEKILPDVLVKGGDYKPEDVVGRKIIEQYGGRIEIVPLLKGFSTSNLIEKVRGER
ncbi:MAG TPA: D-glycero-beta-D-manno-heptose 1-phosphate adenylyltransferase [Chitinophagales bacterium]|nr:D-glycero-beta-D-manno-heptose 1-phosphate adenylyltransferase [Chitinophagales bacterium]